MSAIDDLPDYEEYEEPSEKKYKLDTKTYKRPDILPHYIIVGHGQVRS